MIKKYKTGSYDLSITEIEVERETEHSVWVNGNRSEKFSSFSQYHETRAEAYEYLESKYAKIKLLAESRLLSANENYKNVLELKQESTKERL